MGGVWLACVIVFLKQNTNQASDQLTCRLSLLRLCYSYDCHSSLVNSWANKEWLHCPEPSPFKYYWSVGPLIVLIFYSTVEPQELQTQRKSESEVK